MSNNIIHQHVPSSLLLWALVPIAATAQSPGEAPTVLEDITVTATRVEKNPDLVPASIGVVGQDDVQFANQQLGLDESLNAMPGIFMQNRYNFAQDLSISIRGFGARSSFGVRGIKILVDGIPETLPDGQANVDSIDIGSIERMEVIRGPVSSLYGNASGGAILITTEEAPETPFISLRPLFGEDGLQKHQLKFGGKQDRFDYLVNLSDLKYDGYRDQSATEMTSLNSRFGYDLGAAGKFGATINYTDSPIADDPGGLTAAQAAANPRQAFANNVLRDSGEALEQTRLGLTYSRKVGSAGELMLRNYYVWRDLKNRLPTGASGEAVNLDRFAVGGGAQYTHTQPVRGKDNRVTVGVDLDRQDDDRKRFNLAGAALGAMTQDQQEKVNSVGLYLQDEYSLTPRLELTAGARYDRLEFSVADRFQTDGDQSGARDFTRVSPSLGLRFSPTADLNLYGNISRAFETPTARELGNPSGGGFNQDLDPQIATNFEIGIKNQVTRNTRYELAVFRINVEDELVPFTLGGTTYYENAGKSHRNGAEFLVASRFSKNLSGTLAYTWSDFRFDRFIDDGGNDFGGKTIPGAPENVAHADLTYTHPKGWYTKLDALYVDDFYANNANTAVNDAYAVANLRLGYTRLLGNWELSPFLGVSNVFDEQYNGNVRINAFGARYFEPAPDRDLYAGLTIRYDFNR
ncbi:MAG: TonB-dependent receptor family protein [Thiotrichales bacterium]